MADELLDVVNDDDAVIGQEMRSVVHQKGLQHRGVHVFLFSDDGKMLIQKRSADRASSPSMLDCSVSEHIKAGEGYLEAALRGMKEEMGVEGIELKPLVTIKMEYGPNDNEISRIFEGRVNPQNVHFDPVEISEIKYMSLEDIKAGILNEKEIFCGWFIQLMNWYFGQPARLTVLEDKSNPLLGSA